jgi:hypothetical protein
MAKKVAPRDIVGAVRHARAYIGRLPMRPLLAGMVASLVLGAIPMMLTALYLFIHALSAWYRRFATPDLTMTRDRREPSAMAAFSGEAVNAIHFNELLNHPELL